ncbi:MAG: 4'-phosphopantetheinyl transferase superfamily protein [Ruminococcus sp.]|nr:4'-phosphopantetheinyl transferase superfamily protein [Ruminococcus sp.]
MIMISILEIDRRDLHEHAHNMLREALKLRCVDYNADTPVIKGRLGKPSLAERPDIHYNISHANGIAACLVSDFECGIDCENVRAFRPNVMKRAFSDKERKLVEETPESERDILFFRIWTLKEAYVKALGIGISYPLNTAEFSFSGDEIICDLEGCRFRQYIIDGGKYIVSSCELKDPPEDPTL